ncbi:MULTISPECIES: cobaltochelatase CobT-related protein [Commensalibacter]|uniref:cobaltochelatase CobT-related protein n=1 Tax=Commensalibacter TaxID=1079922 RepID=UPI0018DD5E0E|nr:MULTISPECIES: cobaltochelatase subunit CobT [Commensalibacter]MBH9973951.1 cobaltochelatase subunit CobT [Commensalibacter melissae]MBI0017632.1 cobaltochelatase subunit CobT [Commensalibacter sp. B14384M2]MBI0019299.1 cobaltochelatase subunit CobT [Commensalibacter sp. W8133]MBI0050444.1 cobaltochelatase subunit CobT [Commensalibacter sp. B14384M3]MBI0180054.1 cobaltochelatase subunit CobT [Commensalibacter sp. W8163]
MPKNQKNRQTDLLNFQTAYNPERFKQALIGTIHTLSGYTATNINFCSSTVNNRQYQSKNNKENVYLPQPPEIQDAKTLQFIRGQADALALYLKYHDNDLPSPPDLTSGDAQNSFNALEQVRVEALGSKKMAGVAANLQAVMEHNSHIEGHARMNKAEQLSPAKALSLLVYETLTGKTVPTASRKILQLWRNQLTPQGEKALKAMKEALTDQDHYAQATKQLLQAYRLLEGEEEKSDNGKEESSQDTADQNKDSNPDYPEEKQEQQESELEQQFSQIPLNMEDQEKPDSTMGSDKSEKAGGPSQQPPDTLADVEDASYHIYTKLFDEVVTAEQICDVNELDFLRNQLDQQLQEIQNIISKLANRLQRKLMSQQIRSWNFDQEEGLLDASKLTRIITNPTNSLSFKQEKSTGFKDTIVTLLIDNSGSMRGRPISIAAMCGDILARTLERCSVKVEILGFTTQTWKGGRSREKWLADKRPQNPGRLNDLRHIIYKAADQPWRRAKRNLGLMLKDGLLKENIDGEALFWAWQRLKTRVEKRKILMVISDGAPVDDSTLSTNGSEYLENHLKRMIRKIENRAEIELVAIGIGHDVTRYYKHAVTITKAEELGGTMIHELTKLFDEKDKIQSK